MRQTPIQAPIEKNKISMIDIEKLFPGDLDPLDKPVVEHSIKLLQRVDEMISGYLSEHEIQKLLTEEQYNRLIYCLHAGFFSSYLLSIHENFGTETSKEILEIFEEQFQRIMGINDR